MCQCSTNQTISCKFAKFINTAGPAHFNFTQSITENLVNLGNIL